MTEAKKSMTFHMTYGMKETYTKARREDEIRHTLHDLESVKKNVMKKIESISIFMLDIYVDVRDLKDEPNHSVSQEDVL